MKNSKSTDKRQAYWQAHVEAHSKSRLTQREYCRQNNISYWSFNSWKRSLDKEQNNGLQDISPKIIQGLSSEEKQIEMTLNFSKRCCPT